MNNCDWFSWIECSAGKVKSALILTHVKVCPAVQLPKPPPPSPPPPPPHANTQNIIQDSHLEKSRQLECQFMLSLSLSLSLHLYLPLSCPFSRRLPPQLWFTIYRITRMYSLGLSNAHPRKLTQHARTHALTHVKVVVGVFIWSVEKSANQKFWCIRTYVRCAQHRRSQILLKNFFFVAVVHKLWKKTLIRFWVFGAQNESTCCKHKILRQKN